MMEGGNMETTREKWVEIPVEKAEELYWQIIEEAEGYEIHIRTKEKEYQFVYGCNGFVDPKQAYWRSL
jgi:hypothetical protein